MTAKRDIEARGPNVEEAINTGLKQLGLKRGDVIVDVIDEGSRGILGLGVREAVVRLVPMVSSPAPAAPVTAVSTPPPPKPTLQPTPIIPPTAKATPPPAPVPVKKHDMAVVSETADAESAEAEPFSTAELEKEREAALEVMHTLLQHMQIEAQVTAVFTEPDDLTGRQANLLQITGHDLGVLIGPRGETLNSLQYITRLMVGNQIHGRADFILDIEGYRERRKQALARLAERTAEKVLNQRRPMSLEPMPPNERRIIHVTLRDYHGVYTESSGEGNRRRVKIIPK